jgi:hypothetical protein
MWMGSSPADCCEVYSFPYTDLPRVNGDVGGVSTEATRGSLLALDSDRSSMRLMTAEGDDDSTMQTTDEL